MQPPFSILFEDPHLVVINKSAGLLSQGDISGETHLVDLMRKHFGRHYVGLVHRLDRNTSGLMVIAKRSKAADRLTQSLQNGKLVRHYLAWVEGIVEKSASRKRWQNWLIKNEQDNTVRIVAPGTPKAKEALLEFTVERHTHHKGHPVSVLRLILETGRSHQIRVQCQAHGYPLLGDSKYGSKVAFERTALHSCELWFPHPMGNAPLHFQVDAPAPLNLL